MNEQLINKILEVSGDFVKGLNTLAPSVVNEIVNYFIFLSVMSMVKNLLFMVGVYVFYRFMTIQVLSIEAELKGTKDVELIHEINKVSRFYKVVRFIVSSALMVYLTSNTYNHLEVVGKALYAPKIFILEKGKEIVMSKEKK